MKPTGGAVRSRLLELRRSLDGARRGREVLERKRELLLGELSRRMQALADARAALAASLAEARTAMLAARIATGSPTIDAAALAQPHTVTVDWVTSERLGVPIPRPHLTVPSFRPAYGPASTSSAVDAAAAAYAGALLPLSRLAVEQAAAQALRRGLARCVRQLSALEKLLIPELEAELRAVASALEEEERDEWLRRKRFLEASGT